jgi:hypothetical protein
MFNTRNTHTGPTTTGPTTAGPTTTGPTTTGPTTTGAPRKSRFATALRALIIILAIVILGIAAWNVSLLGPFSAGTSGPGGFMIFNSIFTLLIVISALAIESFAPHLYHRMVFLALFVIQFILWVAAWAWSAARAAHFRHYSRFGGPARDYYRSLATLAALGAFMSLLLIILEAVRHVSHSKHNSTTAPGTTTTKPRDVEMNPVVGEPKPAHV